MRKVFVTALLCVLPLIASAQVVLVSGYNFGQFLGAGAPSTNGETFEDEGSIGANWAHANPPPLTSNGGQNLGTPGFTNGTGTLYWNGLAGSSSLVGSDAVVGYDNPAFSINAFSVTGTLMALTGDWNGFNMALDVKSASSVGFRQNMVGFSDAGGTDLTFAAQASNAPITITWTYNGATVATTNVGTSWAAYTVDLPPGFYGSLSDLTATFSGAGRIDNVQFNGFFGSIPLTFWKGGNGVWSLAASPENWTDLAGTASGVWATGAATFRGTAGTVTVDNTGGQVIFSGAKFEVSGYTIAGAALETSTAATELQVASGTATISAPIIGTGGIDKTDVGTLVLSGTNTFSGGTTVTAGTLQIGAGGTSGSIAGNVANNAALIFNRSDALSLNGVISGTGAVTQLGSGTTSLTGENTYTGGTTISGGTLQLGNGGTSGSIVGDVTNNATLAFNRSDAAEFNGVISGTGAVTQNGSGTTSLTAANTYSGATTVSAGTLQLGNGGTTGSIVGDVTNNATLAFNRSNAVEFSGVISGTGAVTKQGNGTASLTAANTYTGGTTIDAGTLQIGNGGTTGSIAGNVANNATLIFNRSNALSFGGVISGTGAVTKSGAGTTTFTGANTYTGATNVGAGTLLINGNQSGATGLTIVASGGTLGGTGTVGAVTIANGGILRGQSGQLFTTGNLIFGATANLNVALGAPSTTGLFQVNGALTLDGLLNVTDAGSFGPGLYRLINYTGTLTDNGLAFGPAVPVSASDLAIQTSVANQVNLIFTATAANFWGGGAGTWNANTGSTAWTNFNNTVNTFWSPQFAIFQNTPGTVTVDNGSGAVLFTGAQFAVNGYSVAGGNLTANTPGTVLRVGDGTAGGSTISATISAPIIGTSDVEKTDFGTLVLTGANTYSGGTTVSGGTLQLGANGTSGSIAGDVVNNATLAFNRSDAISFGGVISGTGAVTQNGSGTTSLTATNTYSGGTTINTGTLQVGAGGTAGSITGNVVNNATLGFNRSNALSFSGDISGTGAVAQQGSGTTTLTGTSTHTGGTTVSAGTLQIGNGGTTGSVAGNIANNATLAFNRSDALSVDGVISGTGAVTQQGSGTTSLTGANTYSGGTTIGAGTLQLGNGGTAGSIAGNVTNNATLAFNRSNSLGFGGVISGTGAVTQSGSGTTTLAGGNSYTGATTVSNGTLLINGNQAAATGAVNVANGGTLGGTGTTGGVVTVANGGTLLGTAGNVFTMGGLNLSATSLLNLSLGAPSTDGLFQVNGGLVLDGSYNITNTGGFGPGLYRLFNYSGALTDNGLTAGTVPSGINAADINVQTSVANQVNLVLSSPSLTFWSGGSGTWSASGSSTAWNDFSGTTSGPWSPDFAVFQAPAGTVTVDTGAGAVAFTGAQFATTGYTVTGGALSTTTANTILRVGDGTAGGSAMTATIAAPIAGTGGIEKTDFGTLVLSGPNSYTGTTTVSSGTLQINGNQAAATGAVTVASGATLGGTGTTGGDVTVQDDGTLLGQSGSTLTMGALSLSGAANLSLTLGAATPTPLFVVNGDFVFGGPVDIFDAGGFSQGLYPLFNYTGTLTNNFAGFRVLPTGIDGADLTLQTSVANQVNLLYLSPSSSLPIWVGGNALWSVGPTEANWASGTGATAAWRPGAAFFGGAIPGVVTVDTRAGPVVFTQISFAVGGYVIAGDALTTDTANTIVSVGSVALGGNQMTATISAPIDGSGGINKTEPGTLVLSGVNTYTGGTTVTGGVLQISSDENLGADGTALTFNGGTLRTTTDITTARNGVLNAGGAVIDTEANNLLWRGGLSGSGKLNKIGTGLLTLSGNNTYTGATSITQGGIQLNGSSLSSTAILPGAKLTGAGTIRGNLTNSGTLSPGTSPGTITVTGNYTQNPGGVFAVELASATSFDKLLVTGTASLDGTLSIVPLPTFSVKGGQSHRIIEATGGVLGKFSTVNSPWSAVSPMLRFDTLYNPKDVTLQFTQLPFAGVGTTPNLISLGEAIDAGIASAKINELQDALNQLPTTAAVGQALDELSPQRYEHWFDKAVYNAGANVRAVENRLAMATIEKQRSLWAEVTRRETRYDAESGSRPGKATSEGILVGGDLTVATEWHLGAAFAYNDELQELDKAGSSTETERFSAMLYGRYELSPVFLEAVVGGSFAKLDSVRNVAIPGYFRTAESVVDSSDHFFSLRAGYPRDFGSVEVTPFAALQHVGWKTVESDEKGANEANLYLSDQSESSLSTRLGVTAAWLFSWKNITLSPKVSLAWRHELNDDARPLSAEIGGNPFTVYALLPSKDGIVADFGLDAAFSTRLTAYARFSAEWSTAADKAMEGKLGLEYRF